MFWPPLGAGGDGHVADEAGEPVEDRQRDADDGAVLFGDEVVGVGRLHRRREPLRQPFGGAEPLLDQDAAGGVQIVAGHGADDARSA